MRFTVLFVLVAVGCVSEQPTGTSCGTTSDCRKIFGNDSFCVRPGPLNFGLPTSIVVYDGLCYDMPTQHACVTEGESYVPVVSLSGVRSCNKADHTHTFYDVCINLTEPGTMITAQGAVFTNECGPDPYSSVDLGYLAR